MTETRDRIWSISRTTCACGKWAYPSRRQARRAARVLHPGERLRAYACLRAGSWHFGHLPKTATLPGTSGAVTA
jgi:hypothetical protein